MQKSSLPLQTCYCVCWSCNIIPFIDITMTSWWARWHLKSPASRLVTQLFIEMQIKENIKALRHWPLCGKFTVDRWIPPKLPVMPKMFPFDDVIMNCWTQRNETQLPPGCITTLRPEYSFFFLQILVCFFRGLTGNKSALVEEMAWHHTGKKPLPEPIMAGLLTHNAHA